MTVRFWRLWNWLDVSREWQVGMGGAVPSPIRVSEIIAAAGVARLRADEAIEIVQAADLQWRLLYTEDLKGA